MNGNAITMQQGWEAELDLAVGQPGMPGFEIHHIRSGAMKTIADLIEWYLGWIETTVRPIPNTLRILQQR